MPKEFKNYALKSSVRPAVSPLLSTTVAVTRDRAQQFYCYVTFSEKLVQAVGKKLPQGISVFNPAYLHVVIDTCIKEEYQVWARYAANETKVLMWSGELVHLPKWVKFFKVKEKHGKDAA